VRMHTKDMVIDHTVREQRVSFSLIKGDREFIDDDDELKQMLRRSHQASVVSSGLANSAKQEEIEIKMQSTIS